MKNKRFIQAMGEIDDRILQRYDEIERRMAEPKPNRNHLVRWASLAACLCIIFTSVFFLQRKNGNNAAPSIDVGGSEESTQGGIIAETGEGFLLPDFIPNKTIFSTVNADEYKNFAKSKELPIKIFSLDDFACFGVFDYFIIRETTDHSELSMTYRFQFASISVYGKSTFNMNAYTTWYGDIYIEEEDLHSLFYLNPERQWLANSNDDKSIYLAYKDKYGITSKDRCLHFKITDTVALRWHRSKLNSLPVIVVEFDDYQMEISLSPEYETQEDGALIYANPTIQALLTKSTAQKTAEELYALWKDALK